ncbi:hypothetical protein MTTB_13070 [Methanothermobacter tenebrarum]|uniref:DUF11 domain-containing protein n=1 Tax=Methanothermobacter tenebrarum TaxID=680118 RepID=A0ABN6PEM8_9EURY|nr:DUF11 domain-containing protein [Methanothermobacter tenebrarum]MDD3454616.1 DUF11 domain-containing protein [Methanobacteriales archaeon]BDH79928.1 hypothetical protein MTTB_13070 [Methanothermobacter tenebrarum]
MKKIAPILALVMLVSIIGAGAVAAQEDDLPDGEADLAVDVTLTDSEGNPLDEATVGDEVVGVVEAANNGPDDATGVVVYLWQQGFGNPDVENIVNWWSVSWDGVNWVDFDPSFDPEDGIWDIGDMPAGDVYTLLIGFTAKEAGPGILGAGIEGDQYDPDYSNNEDEYVIDILEPVIPVSAGKVPMQPTGAPLALAILSVLMTIAGLTLPKIK